MLLALTTGSATAGTGADALASGPAGAASSVWAGERLVGNAGFEEATTAARWSVTGPVGAVTVVSSPVRSGGRAARITDTSTSEGVSLRSDPLTTIPGEEVTATGWANRTSGAGGWLYLEFWRASGSRISATAIAAPAGAGWQRVTADDVAPDEAVTFTVLLYSAQAEQNTVVWDDLAVASAGPAQSRIPNAGFEEVREGQRPTQWTVAASGGAATVVASGIRTGRRALRITDNSTSEPVSALSRQVPVTSGTTVTASAWARRDSGTSGVLYLEYRRADGSRIEPPATASVAAVSGWQRVRVAAAAPAGAVSLTVRLYSLAAATGATTWDDVELRTSTDPGYAEPIGTGTVLFVGDQRVESYRGVARVIHPGTKTGDPALAGTGTGVVLAGGGWDANPRVSGTVLPAPDGSGYRMWYTAAAAGTCGYCTGYAESADGLRWSRSGTTGPVYTFAPAGVVENPNHAPGRPRYFMLHAHGPGVPVDRRYYAAQSIDGVTWSPMNSGSPVLPGWDVANVSYDPVTARFIATTKQYPVDYAASTRPAGPRTVWVSTSTNFVNWTAPRPSFAADPGDDSAITDAGRSGTTPWSEVYGMPAVRYGEQYLGLPWIFDIVNSPSPLADPGPDKGRQHIGLAASDDLLVWSRPARGRLVQPGAAGSWDWGYHLTGSTLLTVGDQVRLYYSSFAGEHSCSAADVPARCGVPMGNSRVGLATWQRDRFVSFRAQPGGGTVTTRTLAPAGRTLSVNVAPNGGQLRIEVLDAAGVPVPGYTLADSTPITTASLDAPAGWGTTRTLPTGDGPLRLRFHLSAGDLYSYAIT
ncbi:carbohydrate binding domain-containing protein [Plantactinospora sp. WMMC1484]|uniref:carbohydrate binding domain-containing protein n=1 Tax=Plantactinospora sp. WMMC1484 TaxID=3404122 RepID=UPI003BF58DF9